MFGLKYIILFQRNYIQALLNNQNCLIIKLKSYKSFIKAHLLYRQCVILIIKLFLLFNNSYKFCLSQHPK